MSQLFKKQVQEFFRSADINIVDAGNEHGPADLIVNDKNVYSRLAFGGTLAFMEAYADGSIDCSDVAKLIEQVLRHTPRRGLTPHEIIMSITEIATNRQDVSRSRRVGREHYDITPKEMLGKWPAYTCAFFEDGAESLDQAQEHKLRLICKKLHLRPGMKVLDIGCGYGALAKYITEFCPGTEIVGITLSDEQLKVARQSYSNKCTTYYNMDYRHLCKYYKSGYFDRIVSVGMYEHVGQKNWNVFFDSVFYGLNDNGVFLLHTIVGAKKGTNEGGLEKYIFPGGQLPPVGEVERDAFKHARFILHDTHEFGTSYAKTLHAWNVNFREWWATLSMQTQIARFGDAFPRYWSHLTTQERIARFYRLWTYYLGMCEGVFNARHAYLYQYVFTKPMYRGEEIQKIRHIN